uniref:non-specific serine/threonine protein kinase n=1 Tax=Aegilops tauschii subsp. strangulata TaxID=200361 RepID=A0A453DXJ6_AEGTS
MAAVGVSSPLLLLFLLLLAATSEATTFYITNGCPYTIWPAALPIGGGMQLDPGKPWTLNTGDTNTTRLWARTGCSFDGNGTGTCQTGDCGGLLACKANGRPPNTIAEFRLGGFSSQDFFDISFVEGFNVPMDFLPVPAKGGPGCSKGPRCGANITAQCPTSLKAPGGCNSPCTVFKQDRYCCTRSAANNCSTTDYSDFFKKMCPDAYSYPMDDATSTFSCPAGTNYKLQGTPMRFTFEQLKSATEQFADKLGEGGFGSVFKGQFGDERIAVKRLDRSGQGKREFSAEVQTIGSIHHINLVRLIGFCAEKSHRLLVYEYMPKGSLDRWIYCRHDNDAPPLDWSTRCKIITQIAKGLSYLHEECTKRIAHLDVKPQNILLDDNFNAKLSDFGLCKLIDRDMSQVVTRMRGTPGYLAPEWLTSHITEKADIYSFGVVVMEIISGRKNLDTSRSEESIHLITLLEEKVKSDRLVDLIDNSSNDMQAHKQDVIQMMMLAMWCLQIDCKKRPKMSEVVKVLEGTMKTDLNIEHNFVVTTPANFGSTGNVSSSAPPLASDVSEYVSIANLVRSRR